MAYAYRRFVKIPLCISTKLSNLISNEQFNSFSIITSNKNAVTDGKKKISQIYLIIIWIWCTGSSEKNTTLDEQWVVGTCTLKNQQDTIQKNGKFLTICSSIKMKEKSFARWCPIRIGYAKITVQNNISLQWIWSWQYCS